jgi:hypothetical protein
MIRKGEVYLGDGLYASWDGWQVNLRAPRKDGDHWVALEPAVWVALQRYYAEVTAPPLSASAVPPSPDG